MYVQKVGNKQKNLKNKLFFVGILWATDEKSRIRTRIRKSSRIHNTGNRPPPPQRLKYENFKKCYLLG